MKALALFGLLFVSGLGFAHAQPELTSGIYGACEIYHRLQPSINTAAWLGDCGPGLAEGYGEYVFVFKDKVLRSNYMRYKNGRPATSYSFSSDPIYGNRLLQTNADLSITVLKDCGNEPIRECAAIVNFAYDRSDKRFWKNQEVKGSYSGPRGYPEIDFDRTTSGGITPLPAKFLGASVGPKVLCTDEALKESVKNPNIYNPTEARPCDKEKEFTKYSYYYLTTLEQSCPSGMSKKYDRWKDLVRGDMYDWLALTIKACSQPQ